MSSVITTSMGDNKRVGLILKCLAVVLAATFVVIYSYLTATVGMTAMVGIALLPSLLIYLWFLIDRPKIGLITIFVYGYFMMGIYRYYNGFPLGGIVDILIVITFIAVFFKAVVEKFDLTPMKSTVSLLALMWMVYGVLQLANPAAPGVQGWAYAVRGYNFHMWGIITLSMLLFRKERDVNAFIMLWSVFTMLAALKGMLQYYYGFSPSEWAWLDSSGERNTHILASGVRVFSFLSDASQFGAVMGHSATVFIVLAIRAKNWSWRTYFGAVALMALIGVSLSGTRGSLFIPMVGAVMYIILSKNAKMIIAGGLALLAVFLVIKYTNIGDSKYPVRRMRSAFNLNDPSLLVRIKHQQMFMEHNSGRPFGSGIGSSYHTAKRLYPGSYLSTFATDSWYWAIYAEQGIVGVILYLIVVLYILIYGAYICMYKIKDKILAHKMKAFLCGFTGLLVAAYVNEIIGQFPTNIITYITIGFVFTAPNMLKESDSKAEIE